MYKYFCLLILSFLTLLNPNDSFAWGKKGHGLVAEVAFTYLDTKTQKIVLDYLDGMSIEDAANWMDQIKSDKKYDNMQPYHYVNFEKGAKVVDLHSDNIISILKVTIAELKNNKDLTKEETKTKILILFHLIGDLHQPLHVGYGTDKGGNGMKIQFNDKKTNLHSLWDSGIIENKSISLENCLAANTFSKRKIRILKKINVLEWSRESRKLLKPIYEFEGDTPSEAYINQNVPLIESQILKGGIRLASVLESIFGDSN